MKQRSKKILWGAGGTFIAIFPALLLGHVEGPDVRNSFAPGDTPLGCASSTCHTDSSTGGPVPNPAGGSVTATFSSGTTYTPGGPPITISVIATDPVNNHFGFQMTARMGSTTAQLSTQQAGHFATGGPNQGVFCDNTDNFEPPSGCGDGVVEFIEHAFPNMDSTSQTTDTPYVFTWTPPATDVGPVHFYVAGNVVNNDHMASGADHVYKNSYILTAASSNQPPTVANGGVLNAASFSKTSQGLGSAVAPGSLVAIFGSYPGASVAAATSIPYSTSLGGINVAFIDSSGKSHPASLQATTPTGPYPFITAQVPFEVLSSGQTSATAQVVVTMGGQSSAPQNVPIVQSAPGVFTIPATGQGAGILVYVDTDKVAKIAAPTTANLGYPTAPIARGTSGFFYATGLGPMTPAVADGASGIDGVTHEANLKPTVTIGGITAPVAYWGPSGYPGVYQVNITVPQGAPTGDGIALLVTTPDGSVASNTATVSVK